MGFRTTLWTSGIVGIVTAALVVMPSANAIVYGTFVIAAVGPGEAEALLDGGDWHEGYDATCGPGGGDAYADGWGHRRSGFVKFTGDLDDIGEDAGPGWNYVYAWGDADAVDASAFSGGESDSCFYP